MKRILCICSAAACRSPTMALVLSGKPYHHDTRCAGTDKWSATPSVTKALVDWSTDIVFAEEAHKRFLIGKFDLSHKRIQTLDIPDDFGYRDKTLIKLIKERYKEL